jgi:hypothetical protein
MPLVARSIVAVRAVLRTLVPPVSNRAAAVRREGGRWPQVPPQQRRRHDRVPHRLERRVGARPHGRGSAREVQGSQAVGGRDESCRVFIFTGGLDDAAPVFSVDASSGTPLFTDGPFVETKEHLGGFAVVDVADEEAARMWAGKIAVACG